MTTNDSFVHISYIIERHKQFPDDIKERFKVMKETASQFDGYVIHDVLPNKRKFPLDFTGTSVSIDDTNLNMYKIDVRLQIDEKNGMTQDNLLGLAGQWEQQLKKESENRRVICYTSLRSEDGKFREIKK